MERRVGRPGRWALCMTLLLTGCWTLRPGSERLDAGDAGPMADGGAEAGADAMVDVGVDAGPTDAVDATDTADVVDAPDVFDAPDVVGASDVVDASDMMDVSHALDARDVTAVADSSDGMDAPDAVEASDASPPDAGPGDVGAVPCDSACPSGQTCVGGRCTARVPVMVAAATSHTCVLWNSGVIDCWGVNTSGQLGNGSTTNSMDPVRVRLIDDAFDLEAGSSHTCARRRSGLTYCWGVVRGWTSSTGVRSTPEAFAGAIEAVSVSLGATNSCAVLPAGTMLCGGINARGDVGDGTTIERMQPVSVMGVADAVAVSAGGDTNNGHVCALRRGGTVSCWGSNDYGQLGDGTMTQRSRPMAVPGLTDVAELAAGFSHTCARLVSGAVRCWGRNHNGQLGDTTTTGRATPGPVPGLTDAVQISTSSDTTCALKAGGQVVCWGGNNNGQIGNGTGTFATTPAAVTGLADAAGVFVGPQHVCAIRRSGRVACWGQNTFGQLGTRDVMSRTTPVDIVLP